MECTRRIHTNGGTYSRQSVYTVSTYGGTYTRRGHNLHMKEDDDDDDNLIVFPPKADDNSNIFIYSVHVQCKTRPECGTSFTMTPAHCLYTFTHVLTPTSKFACHGAV